MWRVMACFMLAGFLALLVLAAFLLAGFLRVQDASGGEPPPEDIGTWVSKFQWEEADVPVSPYTWEPFGSQYSTFWSSTVNKTVSYLVWLPPGYSAATKRYPVVYWLPGGGGSQWEVGSFLQHLEAAVTQGRAPEMIVVGVNAVVCCSFYVNSFAGDLALESVVVNDLIPHVDSTYRTLTERNMRAVEGFSMGGYGAAHLGFKYPEVFGVVSIHAGALFDIAQGQAATCCDAIYRGWNYAFGANEAYFTANSPFTLAQEKADLVRGKSHIRIMVGQEDNHWILERSSELHVFLDNLLIRNEFRIVPGVVHDKWAYYDLLGFSIFDPFYLKAFVAR